MLWCLPRTHDVTQEVEHHVAIEDAVFIFQRAFSKTIVVVPRLHLVDHGLHVATSRHFADFLVIIEHDANILRAESQHLVVFRLHRDVPTNIKTARHIVERDRTHARHKDALKHPLKLLEEITIEPVCVRNGMVNGFAFFIENGIRKVVVFIYDKVKRQAYGLSFFVEHGQFRTGAFAFVKVATHVFGIGIPVGIHKVVQTDATIFIESFFNDINASTHLREIKIEDLKSTLQRSGMLANPEISEKGLEIFFL